MRRRKTAPLKVKTVVAVASLCGGVCLAGIVYVWAKTEVHTLGRQLKTLEVQLDELKRTNHLFERRYATMCTPQKLDAAVKMLNLGLAAPTPDQIVRLVEPAPSLSEGKIYALSNAEGAKNLAD
jgi:hypothetical protein